MLNEHRSLAAGSAGVFLQQRIYARPWDLCRLSRYERRSSKKALMLGIATRYSYLMLSG
jgi:hypothetical protein